MTQRDPATGRFVKGPTYTERVGEAQINWREFAHGRGNEQPKVGDRVRIRFPDPPPYRARLHWWLRLWRWLSGR